MARRRYSRMLQEEATSAPAPLQHVRSEAPTVQQHPIVQLQQALGNQAVQRLLIQRENETEDTATEAPAEETAAAEPAELTLLSRQQVYLALTYYTSRSRDYPPQIITQIQHALGTTETGRADEEMVQAVANWQAGQGLTVDGMAGPRTLPAIFGQGLDVDSREEEFVAFAQQQMEQWDTLGTGEARAQAMMTKINELLTQSEVPECLVSVKSLPNLLGQFDFATWTIEVGLDQFERDSVTVAEYADMANTLYHEARHAEQWFSMARMLAGQNKTADRIATMMGIPPNIAAQAVTRKYDPKSMEALVADGWYQSVYGVSAAHREATLNELSAADTELAAAQTAADANDTPSTRQRLQRARERRQRAYDAYHNLPEETDAHRVGDSITARLVLASEIENMPD